MIAREAVLNHPEVARLLRERFVCIAIDNVQNPNMTDAEQRWLADKGGRACTQGMSTFTAGGKVLGLGGWFEPQPVLRMLRSALAKFRPEEGLTIPAPTEQEQRGKEERQFPQHADRHEDDLRD